MTLIGSFPGPDEETDFFGIYAEHTFAYDPFDILAIRFDCRIDFHVNSLVPFEMSDDFQFLIILIY